MDYCCSASQVHRRGNEAFYVRQCTLQSRQTHLIEAETFFIANIILPLAHQKGLCTTGAVGGTLVVSLVYCGGGGGVF